MLSVRVRGDRPGSNRRRGAHNPDASVYTTATTKQDDLELLRAQSVNR
jgi:hypothetical protein